MMELFSETCNTIARLNQLNNNAMQHTPHNPQLISVGDPVMHVTFGSDKPLTAQITAIELCPEKRMKYGNPVNSVDVSQKDYCVFTLDNNHWAYGEQVTLLTVLPASEALKVN